jgi:hypothetical protein
VERLAEAEARQFGGDGAAGSYLLWGRGTDLAVTQPTKFTFVLDLKTAKTLNLTVPDGLVLAAGDHTVCRHSARACALAAASSVPMRAELESALAAREPTLSGALFTSHPCMSVCGLGFLLDASMIRLRHLP